MNWRDVAWLIAVIMVLNGVHTWGRYEGEREAKKQMRLVVTGYVNGALDDYYKRPSAPPFVASAPKILSDGGEP